MDHEGFDMHTKTEWKKVYLSPIQWEAIEARMEKLGIDSASAYFRQLAMLDIEQSRRERVLQDAGLHVRTGLGRE